MQTPLTETPCDDGNACTQTDTCQDGVCTGGNLVQCAPPDQCHESGICNPSTGLCDYQPTADNTPCDDGNPCTQTDTCQSGVCVGGNPVVCTALDACHDPGVCDTTTGQCTNPAKTDGTSCSDGNACTQTDTCQGGVCTGANPVVCPPPDQCHEAGVCNAATGSCDYQPKTDGTACVGADQCLTVYTCLAGICTGGEPVVCPDPDQCHDAGTCNPATGVCSNPVKVDDTPCDTGNLCTADTCQAGGCTEGVVVVTCPPLTDEQCQVRGTCDPTTGTCQNGTKTNGTPCDDGDACTQTDTCQNGVCTSGNPVICPLPAVGSCQQNGVCDPGTGVCSYLAKPNGSSCETGNRCTADTCQDGVCVEGPVAVSCPVSDPQCQESACDPSSGICITSFKTGSCDDGNACTLNDTCQFGICTAGTPVVCDPPGVCQEDGVCNPTSGTCTYQKKANGSSCPGGSCCNGSCCSSGKVCCRGHCCDYCCSSGDNNGCCSEACCGSICCTFSNARCCPDGSCHVGIPC